MSAPESFDLSTAAKVLLADDTDGVGFDVWQALTGLTGYTETWDHIRATAHAVPPITAHTAPF